jgi:hypothetical protein
MEDFKKHLTFYCSKNATLNTVRAGFDDSFLTWLLLNSFSPSYNPIWSMASTNIVMSDVPINQWSFNHISLGSCARPFTTTSTPQRGNCQALAKQC